MSDLDPFETLYDAAAGVEMPLPPPLERLYGPLTFPEPAGRPYLFANFVETLDGVTALGLSGFAGGGPISGNNQHDRLVMGLLRAVADAVVVGAGTARSVPRHVWTADYIYPSLKDDYARLRRALKKEEAPLNVIVTAAGKVDAEQRVLAEPAAPVLLITTPAGRRRLPSLPAHVEVTAVEADAGGIGAARVLAAVARLRPVDMVLLEGGPRLIGNFLGEGLLEDLFLTLAPQIAGRDESTERPGLVRGRRFAPESPLWGNLVGVKRAASHLFLRYRFDSRQATTEGF